MPRITNKEMITTLQSQVESLESQIKEVQKASSTSLNHLKELLWAEKFNNTIHASKWFLNQQISPGGWAVGYPFLYALYRTLDEMRPHNILELGLGQSTRLISQYTASGKKIKHTVVEHDASWIEFFQKGFKLPKNTELCHLPLNYHGVWQEDTEVVAYEGFKERFFGQKFDLICIDGPFGYLAKTYARTDVLTIMPDCLATSFVLFLDDTERAGEKNTIKEMLNILDENGIKYKTGFYRGIKEMLVLASEDNRFLCSM
ncbi:MAG: hypothetical protein K6E31_02605 [bacterium]|nr:hypothetical protein [bacterium]